MQFQKALEGISFDKSTLNPIYKEMLRSIDLEIYTAENLHYLVNTLVSNSKIPSELAMNRSEGRNLKKIAIQKPQELAKGAQRRVVIQAKAASIFHLPHRYGRKVKTRRDRNRRDGKFIPRQFNRAPVSFGPPTMGVPTPQFFPNGINSLFPSGMVIGQLPVFPSGMYYPPPLPSMATGQLPVFPPAMYTLPSMVTGQLPVFPPAMYPPPPFLGRLNPSPIAISGIRQLSIGMPSSVLPLTPINQETSSVEAQQKNSNIQAQVLNTSNQVKNPSLSLPKGFCITQLLDPSILVARALSKEQIEKQKIQEERKAKLPKQIVRKIKRRVNFKKRNITFQTRSPEWNIIKEHKAQISELIEQKKEQLIKEQNQTVSSKKYGFTPLYFQKKKANQKRRRQQKHNLIKQNRKALLQIFGIAIFNSGWPVSRKQIKEALGLEQKAEIAHEQLGQFMQMAEYKEVEQKLTQLLFSEIPHENQYKEVEQKLTQLLFSEIPHENQYQEVEQKLAQLPLSEVPHESQYNEQQW